MREIINSSRISLMRVVSVAFIAAMSVAAYGQSQKPYLLRDPSLSSTHIAFSYAGNIWVSKRNGGDLHRLTSGGFESKPVFSPDGTQIAFIGDYDGARSVYAIPRSGGEPRRLTFHPADLGSRVYGKGGDMVGWTPDGKNVVFSSQRAAYAGSVIQIFMVPAEGGFAKQLPLIRAAQASFSPDSSRVAYVPNFRWQPEWKQYRGGQTTGIAIANLADSSIEARVPRENSNDFNPMWVGETIYFLSDRNGPVTLFSYDLKSRDVKQVLRNDGLDLKSAAAFADTIVYEQFGSLHLLDLNSGVDRALDIRPAADFAGVRPHFKNIASLAQSSSPLRRLAPRLSPSGARALFALRGEILTVPAEKGDIRNITRTTGFVERAPAWSPDGKSIAYLSNASGEYALHIRDQSGHGEVSQIGLGDPPTFYGTLYWAPDSRKIGYTDKRLTYWYIDLQRKIPVRVDTDLFTDPRHGLQMAWSPDSRWIAYTKQLKSHLHAVFLYSIEQAKSYQVTDGMSDAIDVAFDAGGQCLYFTVSTDTGLKPAWLDMSSTARPVTRSVHAVVLNKGAATPLIPQSDEERPAPTPVPERIETKARRTKDSQPGIDIGGIEKRIISLPIPARDYDGLFAGKPGVVFLVEGPQVPEPAGATDPVLKVQKFDLSSRKTQQILDGVTDFELSFNGEKMLYARLDASGQKEWFIGAVEQQADAQSSAAGGKLKIDAMEVYVEPRIEWKHMYEQVWRNQRDFLYDPGLHGLDLEALKKKYEPFLEHIASRDDLDYLFGEMLSNLSVDHMFAIGPDAERIKLNRAKTGLLGADYATDQGRYRFTHIYDRDPWDPKSRSPLMEPGMSVQAGEYLLAIDGRPVLPPADIHSYMAGSAGHEVVLRVGPKPDGNGSREIKVVPIEDESALRNFAWVESNRRKVDELTGGRVAYVYLPDTSTRGYANFNRYYFAQVGKDAVIIDERFNGGGSVADYIIDNLRRPLLNYFHMREGQDITTPMAAIFGPKVMIINEMAGSGGDALPWMFRRAGIGPLIGKRTWGGLVGAYTNPADLLDGGHVSTPNLAFYNPDGAWDVSNNGVRPDIEVEESPQAARAGRDTQLEKAVEVALDLLKKNPPPSHSRPQYPNHQTSGRN